MSQFLKLATLQLLRAYKWAISPMFPPACRYVPTCSEYVMESVERHGALRGMVMGLIRVCRCHPFARGGYDPVVKSTVSDDLKRRAHVPRNIAQANTSPSENHWLQPERT